MKVILYRLVLTSLSYFSFLKMKPRKPIAHRVAHINTHFGTEFACEPFLGFEGWGFLFDDKNKKVCYFMGPEGELLDFDYFQSWNVSHAEQAFLFLTNDKNRPIIKVRMSSLAEMATWRERLARLLPAASDAPLAA